MHQRLSPRPTRWLALAMVALSACTSITRDTVAPKFSLADLQPLESTLVEQRFRIGVRVTNPNDHPLRIRGGDADLTINGIPFASGVTDQDTRIDAFSDEVVYVTATTNVGRLLEQLGRLAERRALQYRLKGRLKIDALPVAVPFDETGEIRLEDLLRVAPGRRPREGV